MCGSLSLLPSASSQSEDCPSRRDRQCEMLLGEWPLPTGAVGWDPVSTKQLGDAEVRGGQHRGEGSVSS